MCTNLDDWSEMLNIPKLLLGNLSMFFDLIFMFQHYVLFRKANQEYWKKLNDARKEGKNGSIDSEVVNKQQGDDQPVTEDERIINHVANSYNQTEEEPVKPEPQYH